MQCGRGGMGSRKHGICGYPTRSPRYRFMQQLEANKNQVKKPKAKLNYSSVSEAIKGEKVR